MMRTFSIAHVHMAAAAPWRTRLAMKSPLCWSCLAFLAMTSLIACAGPGPEYGWTKTGANQDDLREAQRECTHEASQYSFVDTSYFGGMDRQRDSSATAAIYRDCMAGQGWHRGPNQPAAAASQAPK